MVKDQKYFVVACCFGGFQSSAILVTSRRHGQKQTSCRRMWNEFDSLLMKQKTQEVHINV